MYVYVSVPSSFCILEDAVKVTYSQALENMHHLSELLNKLINDYVAHFNLSLEYLLGTCVYVQE